jgi:putative heme-binding domain-containing protein
MRLTLLLLVSGGAALTGVETKVKLPNSRADLLRGEKLFEVHCALCHGPKGEGARGPMLTRAKLPRAPDDAALLKILEDGIRGTEMPAAGAMSDREMRQTAAYVRSLGKVALKPVPGDAARGGEIYHGKGNCASCHSIHVATLYGSIHDNRGWPAGDAGVAGPDLSGIGDSRSPAYLRESLVNPGAAVPEGYLLVTAVPASGERVTGVRVNEDSFSIQIRDSAGRSYSFWKKDLAKLDKQPGKSLMPSYQGQLSDAELTDLVAFLASLKEAP